MAIYAIRILLRNLHSFSYMCVIWCNLIFLYIALDYIYICSFFVDGPNICVIKNEENKRKKNTKPKAAKSSPIVYRNSEGNTQLFRRAHNNFIIVC